MAQLDNLEKKAVSSKGKKGYLIIIREFIQKN